MARGFLWSLMSWMHLCSEAVWLLRQCLWAAVSVRSCPLMDVVQVFTWIELQNSSRAKSSYACSSEEPTPCMRTRELELCRWWYWWYQKYTNSVPMLISILTDDLSVMKYLIVTMGSEDVPRKRYMAGKCSRNQGDSRPDSCEYT